MKIYNLDKTKYNQTRKSELKQATVNLFGNIIRAIIVEDKWNYCLQDILEASVPQKNCGQHVAEWVRRSAWLDCDVFALDSHTHYAKWADCCELAESFMYVYRQKLMQSNRVVYGSDGSYMRGETPLPNVVSTEACTYRLWRALLDKAPDAITLRKDGRAWLYRSLDFEPPLVLERTRKPKVYSKKPEKLTLPTPIVKADVIKETKAPEPKSVPEVKEDTVKITADSILTQAAGLQSIIGALLSGKKLKIEISLGD